ncbi:SDR family oxidoreductase [Paenibacillus psychroresistens]|uniref:SDR family oxidoreductase n=1 Tax=Paenibacillus psychroresistens TaxID=1778678 RepID=A0A6B8RGM1_9BACL|nr:SDR family oxidoreductase [Paenibacillus psychroresistens]QGQ95087.1 SDR family oxidoreductase [Paenibacillus psychroresistens]
MKTWFITGTSSGFGRSLTELLLERGDRVAATARKTNTLDDLKAVYGDQLWVAVLDVTDTQSIREVVDQAFKELSHIDVVVNNAGYGLFGASEEVSDEQITHQINTNIIGSIQVTRATLPYLRAQGGGRILQLSSMGGQIAFPALSIYHATKWAIEGFIESVVQEVASFNIQVTLVEPGGARTNFAGGSMIAGEAMAVYENTPVGYMRNTMKVIDNEAIKGDPVKMAHAMIAAADAEKAPLRLTLGSDAYEFVHKSLTSRLAVLEAQKDLAYSTDVDA